MAGPYGAAPFKFPPEERMGKGGSATSGKTIPADEAAEMNDTEWPLEKTLPLPKGYTSIGMKRPSTTNATVLLLTMTEKKEDRPPDAPKPAEDQRYAALMKARPGTVATQPHTTQSTKKSEFDPILQCPHCKRRMLEPKVACCRRLCQTCLQQDIDSTAKDGIYWCKMCGSTILIPDPKQPKKNWARQFDTDTFLSNLREAVIQLEGKRLCFVCSSRNVVMDACNYCFDCATYFCNPCTESHRHMPNQKNHRVKRLDQVTATELMKQKKRFCRVHEGVSLDLYCNDHKAAMCQECAVSVHQDCGSITTVAKLATEKKEKLKTAEKVLEVGLSKCEHNMKQFQTEKAEIEQIKQQTKKEIESSFDQVFQALQARKSKLQKDIEEHFTVDQPEITESKERQENLVASMKSKTEFLQQLMQHASDFDILHCADNVFTSAESMASQNSSVVETPRPKVVVKMDDKAVKNFVELVSILGAEAGSTQVKGILLKKITTRLKGDQFTPDIRDIFLANVSHLVAVDNKNMCVKSIQISGDTFITKRLEVKSEPWGGTKLQPSMIAVTGLKVIYIITLSEQMSLQSTVKTRKDYWGVCAISPINLVCSCKYPPGIDIVDITGRRLRSIEEDHLGKQLFEMPTYVAMNGDYILVTDRKKKSLFCVDQEGKVIFVYRGQGEETLEYPHGICVDQQGRIFIADHDRGCVELLSKQGQYLCQVMAAPKPRTLFLDNNDTTLYVSTEGKALTFFNLIEVQT